MKRLLAVCLTAALLRGQEASSGFDLRGTLGVDVVGAKELGEAPRSGSVLDAGFRAILYPTWKLSEHWSVTGAFQVLSRPYTYESFATQGHGMKGNLTMAALTYGRVGPKGSLVVRVGQFPTAFGSFPLRYDDEVNPLIHLPAQYGYSYTPVTTLGLAGAQVDVTRGKWDARVQFSNSSPANPRSVFAKGQFGNWTGGAGYTVRQGFRIGVSADRGPYLDRKSAFYLPGEADPRDLPAHALGVDVQWALGHWNLQGEVQKFVFPYRAMPTFEEQAGYAEVKRVLHPRLYLAVRGGYTNSKPAGVQQVWEATAGFRPNTFQVIKFGCLATHAEGDGALDKTFAVHLVTSVHPFTWTRH
jgi:hypothetical protein